MGETPQVIVYGTVIIGGSGRWRWLHRAKRLLHRREIGRISGRLLHTALTLI